MKKIVFTSAIAYRGIQEAAIPGYQDNQVLLKIERIGVCGTDIQVFAGRNRYMQFPVVPFLKELQRVVKAGADVIHVKAGDRVVIRPIISCGTCYSAVMVMKTRVKTLIVWASSQTVSEQNISLSTVNMFTRFRRAVLWMKRCSLSPLRWESMRPFGDRCRVSASWW